MPNGPLTCNALILAYRLWSEALERDPGLHNVQQNGHAYDTACCASLQVLGLGRDARKLDESAKARLRIKASVWLRADLAMWKKIDEEQRTDEIRSTIAKKLKHWQEDFDLDAIREPESLAMLPEAERKQWETFWIEVEELRRAATGDGASSVP